MGAAEHLHDAVLDLEADDVFRAVAGRHARHLHGHRKAGVALAVGIVHPVDVGHAARVDAVLNREAVNNGSGFQQLHRPDSKRSAKNSGRPARRMAVAAA
jgi:hypothetical protein